MKYNQPDDSSPQLQQQVSEIPLQDYGDEPPPPDFPDDWLPQAPPETYFEETVLPVQAKKPATRDNSKTNVPGKPKETSAVVQDQPAIAPAKLPPMPVVMPPIDDFLFQGKSEKQELRMITVVLRSNPTEGPGYLRMQRIVGLLRSYPGKDRFGLMIFQDGARYQLDFPNDTIGYCAEMLKKLQKMVGEENVQVEILHVH